MAKARDQIRTRSPPESGDEDEALRRRPPRSAFATARDVYDELIANRGVRRRSRATRRSRTSSARRSRTCATPPEPGLQGPQGRDTSLLLIVGLLFNPLTGPETRRWLKDKIFGEDEEFGYGSSGNGGWEGTTKRQARPSGRAAQARSSRP